MAASPVTLPGTPDEAPTAAAHSGFFVLRAPALPFDVLSAEGSLAARLPALLRDPRVREALYVASPSLEGRLESWIVDRGSESGRKLEPALARYVARMAGRATPFGLFAGCSVGAVGEKTRLRIAEACRRHTRLDMDYVVLLADALGRDPELRPALRYRPNSSLYRVAGRARYREVRRDGTGWSHHRAALEVPGYLEAVLARAGEGATPGELARALLDHDPEATEVEAADYVRELIDQQVLVSDLAPALTGEEPVHGLIRRLRETKAGAEAAERLAAVRDAIAAIDAHGPGAPPARYRAIASRLAGMAAPLDESRLFQVDLARSGDGVTLGENVVAEILRGAELLRRITPPRTDELSAFRRAFTARFGDTPVTREVPLAEALDEETGVGFGEGVETVETSTLLEGLELSAPTERQILWGARESHLLARASEALSRGETEWRLTDEDVEAMAVPGAPPLPDAFAALVRLEAVSGEAVARGDFRILLAGATGPSGARLLGRFCHGDEALSDGVARHLREEEALRPDAVFAEIVHLPEGRVGNILLRPRAREHEIAYLGRSGAPTDRQIPLDDLFVSVRGDRVVLRSARLGREVLPRLTSAHNYNASAGVYRFLCAMQGQGVASSLAWDWGPLSASVFLPRVVRGRFVLARAQWRVTPALLADAEAVRRWRGERRPPRWVCLVEGDHELPIDLDDDGMLEILRSCLKGREHATLVELFPAPDRLCVEGPGGHYVHELVVPFVRKAPAAVARVPPAPSHPRAGRLFAPGSEWLSLKLYAGSLVADHLVRDVIGPLAMALVAEGRADRWFFVRYADPHGHLRVRFHGESPRADVLPALESAVGPYLADGRVWKLQLDTYERETERYGGPFGIGPCEEIFHLDSAAAVELMHVAGEDARGDRRWRLALLAMDRLLDDLGLDLGSRREVARRARDAMRGEPRVSAEAVARVGAKYRAESKALADLLDGEGFAGARAALDRRSRGAAHAVEALRRSSVEVADLAPSLLHMHCNRLLRTAQTSQEMVLCDFLNRRYEGLLARGAAALPAGTSATRLDGPASA